MSINKTKMNELIEQFVAKPIVHEETTTVNKFSQRKTTAIQPSASVKDLDTLTAKKAAVGKRKRDKSTHPLRKLRIARGMTLEELSNATQLSTSYISRLEGGERRLNVDLIEILSRHLDCDPVDLLPTSNKNDAAMMSDENITIKDLPIFMTNGDSINLEIAQDWRARPLELLGDDTAFVIIMNNNKFAPRYGKNEQIIASAKKSIEPGHNLLVINANNEITIGVCESITQASNKITTKRDDVTVILRRSDDDMTTDIVVKDMQHVMQIIGVWYI